MASLDKRPARVLTDRECANILGSIIGGLLQISNRANVQNAIDWWANNPGAITGIEEMVSEVRKGVRRG